MPEFLKPYKAERGENLWYVTGPGNHRSDFEFDNDGWVCSQSERDAKILAQQEAGILNRAYNVGREDSAMVAFNRARYHESEMDNLMAKQPYSDDIHAQEEAERERMEISDLIAVEIRALKSE